MHSGLTDEIYIKRCIQLAEKGRYTVFPNPMVGAVIVKDGNIIGEGYHQQYGGPHAEVNAVNSVKDKNELLGATIYVSLEPCCHFGKTPPCTNLIIEHGFKTVVVGCVDPNPLVSGNGVELLRDVGIEVKTGVLESECVALNYKFIRQLNKEDQNLNFYLKWAQTKDGFMGKTHYRHEYERKISNPLANIFVHQIRTELGAVMVGKNTVMTDNPVLDNRLWQGNLPAAIILDKNLEVPSYYNVFKLNRKVVVINGLKIAVEGHIHYVKINFETSATDFWNAVSNSLSALQIKNVLLEGGAQTLNSFFESKLPATIIRISSSTEWGTGIAAPNLKMKATRQFSLGDNLVEVFTK